MRPATSWAGSSASHTGLIFLGFDLKHFTLGLGWKNANLRILLSEFLLFESHLGVSSSKAGEKPVELSGTES